MKLILIALALAGNDLLNCIKQARDFGLMDTGQRVASLVLYEQDIRSLGLGSAQGTLLANSFYWDLDDRTRAFSKRVIASFGGDMRCESVEGEYTTFTLQLPVLSAAAAAGGQGRAGEPWRRAPSASS